MANLLGNAISTYYLYNNNKYVCNDHSPTSISLCINNTNDK